MDTFRRGLDCDCPGGIHCSCNAYNRIKRNKKNRKINKIVRSREKRALKKEVKKEE